MYVMTAAKVLVVGTSLSVYPAASLATIARGRAEKVLVSLDVEKPPYGFKFLHSKATEALPNLVSPWLGQAERASAG